MRIIIKCFELLGLQNNLNYKNLKKKILIIYLDPSYSPNLHFILNSIFLLIGWIRFDRAN